MAPDVEAKARVRAFIARHVRGSALADDEDIFASGYVNSMFAMQLVNFVEQTFAIAVESEDLEIANFRSVDAVSAFVARKSAPAA